MENREEKIVWWSIKKKNREEKIVWWSIKKKRRKKEEHGRELCYFINAIE